MYSVGYAYDPIFLAHTLRYHPESHVRLEAIMALLQSKGELDRLVPLSFTSAGEAALCQVHDADYVRELKAVSARGGGMLGPDTYVTRSSFDAAAMAAGAAISAVDAVLRGEVQRSFALVRPPGHHAFADHGEGFCLFNNTAFAARRALGDLGDWPLAAPVTHPGQAAGATQGQIVRRVMVVDWDVHHGNGTQDIFYEDPRVLYLSTHQSPLYPYSGRVAETGRGAGQGMTVNVPLPAGAGDAGYARAFDEIVVPIARRYRPELILVSAGYDAHWVDLLAGMAASLQGFARMAAVLSGLSEELCEGRIVAVLEGGYDLDVLSYGVLNTFSVLRGDDTVLDPLGPFTGRETPIDEVVQRVKQVHGL